MIALVVLGILIPMALAAAFLLGRHASRRALAGDELSAVTRQHIDLFQGGQLNESLLEAAKSRLGETLEKLWDNRPEGVHPLVVRVAVEVLRLLRRAPQMRETPGEDAGDFEGLEWQMSRLSMLEAVLEDYCEEAPAYLRAALPN